MAANPGFAEISIEGCESKLCGSLVQMSPEGAVVRLERGDPANRAAQLPSGSPACLTIVTGSAVFTVSARVISEVAGDVAVMFSSKLCKVQRRGEKRFACELDVMYRATHPDGRTGAWQMGKTIDVSVGGLCLKVEQRTEDLKRVEVCFRLLEDDGQGPVRAMARVAHQRTRVDGCVVVGLAFVGITTQAQMRLVRFIK